MTQAQRDEILLLIAQFIVLEDPLRDWAVRRGIINRLDDLIRQARKHVTESETPAATGTRER